MNQEVDLAAFPFGLSLARGQVVEHCGFFSADRSSLLAKYPTERKSWLAAVQPFSIQVTGYIRTFFTWDFHFKDAK